MNLLHTAEVPSLMLGFSSAAPPSTRCRGRRRGHTWSAWRRAAAPSCGLTCDWLLAVASEDFQDEAAEDSPHLASGTSNVVQCRFNGDIKRAEPDENEVLPMALLTTAANASAADVSTETLKTAKDGGEERVC